MLANRVFFSVGIVMVLSLAVHGGDGVVRLKVRPMPAPKPALHYLLLPELRELKPGNPAQWYMRCFAEQRNFFFNKEVAEERARFLKMPLSELAKKGRHGYGRGALTQADWAARLDALDWQVLDRVQTGGLGLRQPELGPLRILATALKVRFRIEAAERCFDDAIVTAKTMFAFARHLGENPTRAANQLGLCVAQLALDVLEEMVQQPGCPNLYWALTDLPTPLVDLRKGFQGERCFLTTELEPLRADVVLSTEELEKVVSRLSGIIGFGRMQAGQPPRTLRAALTARAKDAEKVRNIRDRLIEENRTILRNRMGASATVRDLAVHILELGRAKDLIQKITPLQIVLLDEKRAFDIQSDERMKLLALAPWQIDRLGGIEIERRESCLLADLLPAVVKARWRQGRLDRRIALLQNIEALRLYAADHKGKLPEALSDITIPLLNDPFTGKSFVYRVEGTKAHLRGNPPRGEENTEYTVLYEVTLEK